MKFELQYELTPPQIFFCGYRVLKLFCHNEEWAHDIKCSQKWLKLKFPNFKDLVLILPPAATRGVLKKGVFKNFAIFTEKHLFQILFLTCNVIKKRLWHRSFPVNFCTTFTKNLWMTSSILQQFLALYFAIIYSYQLSSSEKSLVGEKIHPYISRILQI